MAQEQPPTSTGNCFFKRAKAIQCRKDRFFKGKKAFAGLELWLQGQSPPNKKAFSTEGAGY
jgi:hypothetical protein